MPDKPVVAIVGRPNVGKSTLFNRIAGRRLAVVEETPGITRDRLYADCEWEGRPFSLVDTGGLDTAGIEAPLLPQVRRQAEFAIEQAAVILMVADGKEGLSGLDYDVADLLRRSGKPVILVVNKVESGQRAEAATEFYGLALGEPVLVSAIHGQDIDVLLDRLAEHLPLPTEEPAEEEEERVQVAIVGRPNVGKSSLLNALLGEPRAIVHDLPGTTRDTIDTPFDWGEHRFTLIDTAGIRRKTKVKESFEYYSVLRAFAAIERADVSLLVVDAGQGVADQDKRIAGYAHEQGKAAIIAINKWDLARAAAVADLEGEPLKPAFERRMMADFTREVRHQLVFLSYAPVVFVSARDAWGLQPLLDTVVSVAQQAAARVPTASLNRIVTDAANARPVAIKGKQLKIYYATQVKVAPPTFVVFVNDPELVHFSYGRYLENRLREQLGLEGTPIRLHFRESGGEGKPARRPHRKLRG